MLASAVARSDIPLLAMHVSVPSSRLALTGSKRSTEPPVMSMIVTLCRSVNEGRMRRPPRHHEISGTGLPLARQTTLNTVPSSTLTLRGASVIRAGSV